MSIMTFRRFPPFKWPELGVPLTPRAGCGAREDMARKMTLPSAWKTWAMRLVGLAQSDPQSWMVHLSSIPNAQIDFEYIIIYESWSWFQAWLELSYKANLVGQCLSSGWHQEAVAAASGRAAGGPFDARDDMHPRIITKSEPFHLWGLDYLEGRRRKTLHPSPSHFCWLNHSFSHLLGINEFQGTGSTSCCEISMQKQQMPRNCKGWGLVTPLDV